MAPAVGARAGHDVLTKWDRRSDQSHIIIDYKTAKYTGTQDQRYPMYEAQLNAYALIGEERRLTPVSALALVDMEPITDDGAAVDGANYRATGFAMGFQANVHEVARNRRLIAPLLARTREIYDLPKSPPGCSSCKNGQLVAELLTFASV